MATPFYKEFDQILENIVTDYTNLDEAPDMAEGSITWIKAACLASMLWGLYKYQDWLANQMFLDSCTTDNLNHWGNIYGIARLTGEIDSDYSARIIAFLQQPPAGGTLADYKAWVQAVPATGNNVEEDFSPSAVDIGTSKITTTQKWMQDQEIGYSSAPISSSVKVESTGTLPSPLLADTLYYVIRSDNTHIQLSETSGPGTAITLLTQGTGVHTLLPQEPAIYYANNITVLGPNSTPATQAGTVTIVIDPNDRNILTTPAMTTLINAVYAYVETKRPVTAALTNVVEVSVNSIPVVMAVTPSTANTALIASDVESYMSNLQPGQTLYVSQLVAQAINDGAVSASVTTPGTDVVVNYDQVTQALSVTVTAS